MLFHKFPLLYFQILFLLKFTFIECIIENLGVGNFYSIYIHNKFIYINASPDDFN